MKKPIIAIIVVLIILSAAAAGYFYSQFVPSKNIEWGLTFSTSYAEYLGFDWKEVYLDMLNDLSPKHLRLMAYWELIEPIKGEFDFQIIDEMLVEAGKRNVDVTLVIGHKQPRWPECHHPAWFEELSVKEQEESLLDMIRTAVFHFQRFDAVAVWQVENEPLFDFGPMCPQISKTVLLREVEAVKSLDIRPVLLSDSGELGRWLPTAVNEPDIFGTTMYRVVHSPKLGYFKYPLPPAFFRIKAGILQTFTEVKRIWGVELQAEPWFDSEIFKTDLETQSALMNPKIFRENIAYAQKAGFERNYLWGVEWWYWLAKTHDDWGMWAEAKALLNSN